MCETINQTYKNLIHLAFSIGFSMKILNHQQRGLLLALATYGGGVVHVVTLGALKTAPGETITRKTTG